MINIIQTPVHLIIGPEEKATHLIEELIQRFFCKMAASKSDTQEIDCFCKICRQLKQRQHVSLVWIEPESNYTVKDVEIIFERTRFALDKDQHTFFVMPRIHTLNLATANRLLKIFEEPPAGYHFLLFTQNEESVLQTIKSRSVIHRITIENNSEFLHPILNYIISNEKINDPQEFEALLKKEHLSDTQSFELLNQLFNYYLEKHRKLIAKKDVEDEDKKQAHNLNIIIEFLMRVMKKPPQQGSSEFFWKMIFISFPRS